MTFILFQRGATSYGFQFGIFWFYVPYRKYWRGYRPRRGVDFGWSEPK